MSKGRAAESPIAVLLVEGSPHIEAELIHSFAEKKGHYELQVVRTVDESLAAVRSKQPTVVIMNFAALNGLEAGADDYHDHPVNCQHLVARMDALLRRANGAFHLENALHFGHLEIRPDEGRVYKEDKEISLTRTEFRLLCELATSPNKVFARETLLDRVWGYGYFGEGRLVDVHVRRLRTKIEVRPDEPQYVVTVRGLGYRFDGEKVKQH